MRNSCIGVSALSNRIKCPTPKIVNWRHNSLPILPAAPVTITTLPAKFSAHSRVFILISSRPSKSSTRISRTIVFFNPSPSTSTGGVTKFFNPQSEQKRTKRSASRRASSCEGYNNALMLYFFTKREKFSSSSK